MPALLERRTADAPRSVQRADRCFVARRHRWSPDFRCPAGRVGVGRGRGTAEISTRHRGRRERVSAEPQKNDCEQDHELALLAPLGVSPLGSGPDRDLLHNGKLSCYMRIVNLFLDHIAR